MHPEGLPRVPFTFTLNVNGGATSSEAVPGIRAFPIPYSFPMVSSPILRPPHLKV